MSTTKDSWDQFAAKWNRKIQKKLPPHYTDKDLVEGGFYDDVTDVYLDRKNGKGPIYLEDPSGQIIYRKGDVINWHLQRHKTLPFPKSRQEEKQQYVQMTFDY